MREFSLQTVGPIRGCAVLQVTGEVDVYAAPMLREQIRELAATGAVHLIADLGPVDFLDSTGLGALVGGLRRLRQAGGSLALVISTPRILRIFQITGLTKAFAAQPSVANAITADPHWQQTAETEAGSVHAWCQLHGLS
jgi:anti-sigma B factor antagonist